MTTQKHTTNSIDYELIRTAENHLNRKHSDSREAILREAGVPVDDRVALRRWVRDARETNAMEHGCIFFACTVREANGVDLDLPAEGGIGCRVSCVEVTALAFDAEPDDEGLVPWSLMPGNIGAGFREPITKGLPAGADPADVARDHREALLKRDDCFATRAEAENAVAAMLAERVAAK